LLNCLLNFVCMFTWIPASGRISRALGGKLISNHYRFARRAAWSEVAKRGSTQKKSNWKHWKKNYFRCNYSKNDIALTRKSLELSCVSLAASFCSPSAGPKQFRDINIAQFWCAMLATIRILMAAIWVGLRRHSGKFSRVRSGLCGWKLGESEKESSLEKSPESKTWEKRHWNAGDALGESCQNGKCAEMYEPGVLGGRARPCSVPNSISFIASVIRQICQLAWMRKRKISVLKNQSRNLSKKSKIIEFLIKVFRNLLSLCLQYILSFWDLSNCQNNNFFLNNVLLKKGIDLRCPSLSFWCR